MGLPKRPYLIRPSGGRYYWALTAYLVGILYIVGSIENFRPLFFIFWTRGKVMIGALLRQTSPSPSIKAGSDINKDSNRTRHTADAGNALVQT